MYNHCEHTRTQHWGTQIFNGNTKTTEGRKKKQCDIIRGLQHCTFNTGELSPRENGKFSSRKWNCYSAALNNTMAQRNPTDIHRTFGPNVQNTCSSQVQTLSRKDHMSGHKARHNESTSHLVSFPTTRV